MTVSTQTPSKEVPSYARPTAASESRRGVFYRAPPSKIRWSGPFRFLDLPPELRNRIYEFAGMECKRRGINLEDSKVQDATRCLPPLLRVSKQLLDEAGSYYFARGTFDILVAHGRIELLVDWLNFIGHHNCKRLASNLNVTIRIVHNCDKVWVCQASRNINLDDAAYVASMQATYCRLLERYAAFGSWVFKTECRPMCGYTWKSGKFRPVNYHDSLTGNHRLFTVSFFKELRAALRVLFALLDDEVEGPGDNADLASWLQTTTTFTWFGKDVVSAVGKNGTKFVLETESN